MSKKNGKKITLITDHIHSDDSYSAELIQAGFEIVFIDVTKEKVIDLIVKHKPDMIIFDVQNFSSEEYCLCLAIKESETLSSIPVIMYTENQDDWNFIQSMIYGADHNVDKNKGVKPLIETISSY